MKKLLLYFTVYIFVMILAIDYGFDKVFKFIFKTEMIEYNTKLVSAPLEIIAETLSKMPLSEMQKYIKSVSAKYDNYPLEVISLSDFNKSERTVLFSEGIVTDVDGEQFNMLIKNTAYVLHLEIRDVKPTAFMDVIAYLLIIGMLLVMNIIMVYYVWIYVQKLNKGAIEFGEGNFAYRIKSDKMSFINSVFDTFNKMAGKIESLLDSSRDLTNAAAHELRTPLARMKFELEKLDDLTGGNVIAQGLRSDVNELEILIAQILTYSRLDRQEDFLQKEKLSVNDFFVNYFEGVKPLGKTKFSYKVEGDCKGVIINADSRMITMAMNNLVTNGFKYCFENVYATLSCNNGLVTVDIADDGCGIDNSALVDIFKPFKRADQSRSRDTGGFGLGLAIVEKIAIMHNGTVQIKNLKNGGANVTFTLPLI